MLSVVFHRRNFDKNKRLYTIERKEEKCKKKVNIAEYNWSILCEKKKHHKEQYFAN